MRLHICAQQFINLRLISASTSLEPGKRIHVHAQCQKLFLGYRLEAATHDGFGKQFRYLFTA